MCALRSCGKKVINYQFIDVKQIPIKLDNKRLLLSTIATMDRIMDGKSEGLTGL